jgi:hypothetical protein
MLIPHKVLLADINKARILALVKGQYCLMLAHGGVVRKANEGKDGSNSLLVAQKVDGFKAALELLKIIDVNKQCW